MTKTRLALLISTALQASTASATPAPIPLPHLIPGSIGVYLTERGQSVFQTRFEEVIERNGYSLSQNWFEQIPYEADGELDIDHLPIHLKPFKGTFKELKDIIAKWTHKMIGNPWVSASFSGVGYQAEFRKIGVRVDRKRSQSIADGRGVVLVFEAEMPGLGLAVNDTSVSDRNNSFLGEMGMSNFWANMPKASEPAMVSATLEMRFADDDRLEFKVLEIDTNTDRINLDFGFDRPMRLPSFGISIDGNEIFLNQVTVEDTLLERRKQLLAALQSHLTQFAKTGGVDAINEVIHERLAYPFSEINELAPPGMGDNDTRPSYLWGMKPERIQLTPNHLVIGFGGFVEDPASSADQPAEMAALPYSMPGVMLVEEKRYDAAITLNQRFVNRILSLDFQRGYYDAVEVQQGMTVRLTRAPEILTDNRTRENEVILRIRAAYDVSGIQKWFLKKTIEFDAEILVKIGVGPDGQPQAIVTRVLPESVQIDGSFIRKKVFAGLIRKIIKGKVKRANKYLASHADSQTYSIPALDSLGGIPLKLDHFMADSAGNFMLYFDFQLGDGNNRRSR